MATVVRSKAYALRNTAGALVALHERIESEDGHGKRYLWRLPDGRIGLNGHPVAELPLYGAERLRDLAPGSTVVLVEGEKAAEALWARGVAAVCTVTGAATAPGRTALRVLAKFDVVIWPDNDRVGHRHMDRCAQTLEEFAVHPRLVIWRQAPPGGDAADFTGTDEELRSLIAAARPLPLVA